MIDPWWLPGRNTGQRSWMIRSREVDAGSEVARPTADLEPHIDAGRVAGHDPPELANRRR
jgi:hypothetical protein